MLKAEKTKIVDGKGRSTPLRGVNVGGWLMMEAYFMHSPNYPEQKFRKAFIKVNGSAAMKNFDLTFRSHFIQESDFKKIASFGFNCVRVPFHYRLVESGPFKYSNEGVKYLDNAVRWAEKYKIYVILDLHAVPGSQNNDWHSDSFGEANFWKDQRFQERAYSLWEFLAGRYKDHESVAGYDLLNESVLDDTKLLNRFYRTLIKRIRKVDGNHILFIEGNKWAMDIQCLDRFDDGNYALSIHNYEPLEFTFNLVPHLRYPLNSKKWNYVKSTIKKLLVKNKKTALKHNAPILVGEFGVNYRDGIYGEDKWLKDTLDCYNDLGFSWTYWTYKAMKNSRFPDGIHGYYENPPWVNREGPESGWEMYPSLWKTRKNEMASSWLTKNFKENTKVLKVLKDAAK